jgi:hypothetical protein
MNLSLRVPTRHLLRLGDKVCGSNKVFWELSIVITILDLSDIFWSLTVRSDRKRNGKLDFSDGKSFL